MRQDLIHSQQGLDKIAEFFDRIGNCDDGHAVRRLIEIMNKRLG